MSGGTFQRSADSPAAVVHGGLRFPDGTVMTTAASPGGATNAGDTSIASGNAGGAGDVIFSQQTAEVARYHLGVLTFPIDASSNNLSKSSIELVLSGSTPVPAGKFAIKTGGQVFNTIFDPTMGWGYNFNIQSAPPITTEPGFWWQIETNYRDAGTNRKLEAYLAYAPEAAVGAWQQRPIFIQVDSVNHAILTLASTAQKFTWNYDNADGTTTEYGKILKSGSSTIFAIENAVQPRLQLIAQGTVISEIRTAGGGGNLLQIQCATGGKIQMGANGFSAPELTLGNATIGFYNSSGVAKQTVTGSKGANAALTSLMAALVAMGLVTDTTT